MSDHPSFGVGEWHVGRSFSGHPIEDSCPCPKAPCGLVVFDTIDPACSMHRPEKTIRQRHLASDCPSVTPSEIIFFTPDAPLSIADLADAECVIGLMPDGSGRVIKNREGPEGALTASEVAWLRLHPTKRPEDLPL